MSKSCFRIRFLAIVAGLALAAIAGASPASAGTATTTFAVTATVLSDCTVAATNLVFGNYAATTASPTDADNQITAICNNGEDYTLALNEGAAVGASVADRYMTLGLGELHYNMYTTAARTTIWGDGTLSTSTVSGVGTGLPQFYTVHGRIPISQSVNAGAYADLVTVTLTSEAAQYVRVIAL